MTAAARRYGAVRRAVLSAARRFGGTVFELVDTKGRLFVVVAPARIGSAAGMLSAVVSRHPDAPCEVHLGTQETIASAPGFGAAAPVCPCCGAPQARCATCYHRAVAAGAGRGPAESWARFCVSCGTNPCRITTPPGKA